MAELIINVAIIGLTMIGALYAIGLIIIAVIGEPTPECDCGCGAAYPLDICSSECDQLCADNNHYEGQEWRCHY